MFLRTFGGPRPPTVAPRSINLFKVMNSDCDLDEGMEKSLEQLKQEYEKTTVLLEREKRKMQRLKNRQA